MGDVLQTLQIAEDRSELDIARDILQSSVDTIRIKVEGPALAPGRISVEAGAQLFLLSRDLLLAAACAALDRRPVFASRKPGRAMDYLRQVRLGPPEPGSFVITIESPLPPNLHQERPPDEPPFERQVTAMLAHAVERARSAASLAVASGDMRPFWDVVPYGVHANLCEALAGMLAETEARTMSLDFQWAPGRPAAPDVPRGVSFAADVVPVLREASRIFRDCTPRVDFELSGTVVHLQSQTPERGGTVTIAGLIDGVFRRVRLDLDGPDYGRAIDAHRRGVPLRCEGELSREGRTFTLRNARRLILLEEL